MPDEESPELRSGITAAFSKTLNEVLQIGPRIRFFVSNNVRPSLIMGIIKGLSGTPGTVAAVSVEKDRAERIRLLTQNFTALKDHPDIAYIFDSANNATEVSYTVPAGKILYLLYAQLTTRASTDNKIGRLHINDGGRTIFYLKSQIDAVRVTDVQHAEITFPIPLPITAGDVVGVYSSAATIDAYIAVIGVLENA